MDRAEGFEGKRVEQTMKIVWKNAGWWVQSLAILPMMQNCLRADITFTNMSMAHFMLFVDGWMQAWLISCYLLMVECEHGLFHGICWLNVKSRSCMTQWLHSHLMVCIGLDLITRTLVFKKISLQSLPLISWVVRLNEKTSLWDKGERKQVPSHALPAWINPWWLEIMKSKPQSLLYNCC